MLLIGSLPMSCSTCFLTQPRTSSPGAALSKGYEPSHVNQEKDLPTGQPDGIIFSIEILSSQMILACFKLTKKINQSKVIPTNQYRQKINQDSSQFDQQHVSTI